MDYEYCPECFSMIARGSQKCKYCGFSKKTLHETRIRNTKSWRVVLAFTGVLAVMFLGFFLVDFLAGGGNLGISSNCGNNEQCLITGLTVCNPSSGNPSAFGLQEVVIKGEENGYCMVDVRLTTQERLSLENVQLTKTCAFSKGELSDVSLKTFYLCENFTAPEEYEVSLITRSFQPLDEQLE